MVCEPWMKIIPSKWLDQNKGDNASPNYRSRLVGCGIANEKRDDFFAATPPLESLRAILAICAARQKRRQPHRLMALDVARAYFYVPALRVVFIQIPAEDRLESDVGKIAQLNLNFYGTRDAPKNWTASETEFLNELGFKIGARCPCNFAHRTRELTVHRDDFTASASDADFAWLEASFKKFECKVQILGPGQGQLREVRIVNRVLRWTSAGIFYEPDHRRAETMVHEIGLEGAKVAPTAGTREEQKAASVPLAVLRVEVLDESPELGAHDARSF